MRAAYFILMSLLTACGAVEKYANEQADKVNQKNTDPVAVANTVTPAPTPVPLKIISLTRCSTQIAIVGDTQGVMQSVAYELVVYSDGTLLTRAQTFGIQESGRLVQSYSKTTTNRLSPTVDLPGPDSMIHIAYDKQAAELVTNTPNVSLFNQDCTDVIN